MYEIYDPSPSFLTMLVEQAAARRARQPSASRQPRLNVSRLIANIIFGGTVIVSAACSTALFVPIFFGK